jgi:pimeloyl-ACP methyl ester carboxylesterase
MKTERVKIGRHWHSYSRSGRGEPVLLVHGITTWSFIWRKIVPVLEQEFEVIATDLLGCGESDMPLDVSYALSDHAERCAELADALRLPRLHFVGHDLGGGIGQIFAVRHPDRLIDLSLVNSVAYDFWPVQPIIALRTPIVRQFLMATVDWGTFRLIVQRGLHHAQALTPELMELFSRPLGTAAGRKAFLHFARCLDNHNLTSITEDLRRLKLPVLIVRGDADPYLSAAIAEKLHREIPGSKLLRTPTASHFIQEDEPEWLANSLREFLESNRA